MIDPRFATAGAVPLVSGYGAQQLPVQYHHNHRHHRHHKHKVRNDQSPVSLDESIHKVDHSQPQYFQNDGAAAASGYGVPFGNGGYSVGQANYYSQQPQQQQYASANFGYGNQYQNGAYGQVSYGIAPGGPSGKRHRRRHRHHRRHTTDVDNTNFGSEQAQAVPEQLIGQRSSSALGDEQQQSPIGAAEVQHGEERPTHRRHHHHRHHHHHQQQQQQNFGSSSQAHHSGSRGRTTASGDGYGHINDELIFIERGEHSPHRQEPPHGYEYKGKIEVQSYDRETRVQGQTSTGGQTAGPCPPGWTQAAGQATGPCPPGWTQVSGAGGAGYGAGGAGYGAGGAGYGAGGAGYGAGGAGYGAGYGAGGAGYGAGGNYQVVADYAFGSNTGRLVTGGSTGYTNTSQQEQTSVTGRATIIEVWQKRSKSGGREKSHSKSRSHSPRGPNFDFDRFRAEILSAIQRISGGRDGGTQTITTGSGETKIIERVTESQGEVRVIVQPIQPVFYMSRQTTGPTPVGPGPAPVQPIGPTPVAPQPAAVGGAPNVVYVPRNVYVPVIKPVFVPRERVIVRPQVIHVARPVLVDRPVPVTQRPIIIDRERPVPVPVRGQAAAAQGGGSKIVQEEFVYRDNLPVAYGGRCAEFAGGVNYGYKPAEQTTHYQQSQTSSHVEVQQGGGAGSFSGSYSNLAETSGAQTAGFAGSAGGSIEILDSTVNPNWQRTDQSSLYQRYGRSAYEIVHKGEEVEQQMYSEIRRRSSSGGAGVVRSASQASYCSSTGGVGFGNGGVQY